MRSGVLAICTRRKTLTEECDDQLKELTRGYNGVEGFLGENFCEEKFGMTKTRVSSKDIDGFLDGGVSVQVKFKWVTPDNFKTRYIQIKPGSDFDVMIVVYADIGDTDVTLFGAWTRQEVLSVAKEHSSGHLRINLKDLDPLPRYELGAVNPDG